MTPTPSAPSESPLLALAETPGFALETGDHRMVMLLAASVFGKTIGEGFGGISDESNARNGTISPPTSSPLMIITGSYVSDPSSTNTINIFLETSENAGTAGPGMTYNCTMKWLHVQSDEKTSWLMWRRASELTYISYLDPVNHYVQPNGGALIGASSLEFSDQPHDNPAGFCVFPHSIDPDPMYPVGTPTYPQNKPQRPPTGACIYLYAAGTKGIISRHKRDGALLKAAAPNKVTVVDLPDNGLVGYDCEADEAIIFWIGLQDPYQIPIWAIPPPPDFDPATKGLMLIT